MPGFVRITWKVGFDAFWHFTEDDGWAMASHVALSALLAIFPFLIFGTTLASFLGADQLSETAVHLIFDNLPRNIAGQFVTESGIVGLLGGIVGGSAGVLLTVGVAAAKQWTPVLDARLALGAPLLGAAIGVIAGALPARRASRIEPVAALRGATR